MGIADKLFDEQEERYFESRGRDLPETANSEEPRSEPGETHPEQPVASEADDGGRHEEGDERADTIENEGGNEDGATGESADEERPKRDFEKAYHSERL